MARTKKSVGAGDDGATMRLGRTASYTLTYDWITLAVSPMADSLFRKIRMHYNSERGKAYPGKERLAVMMWVPRGDAIDPWMTELIDIGAIEILAPSGMRGHNEYVINDLPPDGYTGPINLDEWAKQFKPVVDLRRKAAADKTRLQRKRDLFYLNDTPPAKLPAWFATHFDVPATPEEWAQEHEAERARRAKLLADKAERAANKAAGGEASAQDGAAKPQVKAVTGGERLQDSKINKATVTGGERLQVTGQEGLRVTGPERLELDLDELDLVELKPPPPPVPTTAAATRTRAAQNRGIESSNESTPNPEEIRRAAQEDLLLAELRTIMEAKPASKRWGEAKTRDTLTRLRERRDFPVVRLVLLHLANGTFGFTASPARALKDGPWWPAALTEYRTSPEYYMPTQRGPVAGCDRCDDHGWLLTDDPIGPAVRCTHAAMAV